VAAAVLLVIVAALRLGLEQAVLAVQSLRSSHQRCITLVAVAAGLMTTQIHQRLGELVVAVMAAEEDKVPQ
jgi:hypothetical protein